MVASPVLLGFLIKILCFTFAVYLTARIMPGIEVKGLWSAFWVSLTYAFLNFVVYEIFGLFSFSFGVVTLGLGFWIINATLLLVTDHIVDGFRVRGFFTAAFASLVITLFNGLIVRFIGLFDGRGALWLGSGSVTNL